jgi:hypothetical protein
LSDDPLMIAGMHFNALASTISEIDACVDWPSQSNILPHTYHSLRRFLGARTIAITVLIAERLIWDAEIILRSANECSMKAAFIFLDQDDSEATTSADEFFGEFGRAHKRRDASRAAAAAKAISKSNSAYHNSSNLLLQASNELSEDALDITKVQRRAIEERWNYTAIVHQVLARGPNANSKENIGSMLHSFAYQSHLIHCNPAALGLEMDAQSRAVDERNLKDRGHAARIYHDLASAWLIFFLIAEQHFQVSSDLKKEVSSHLTKLLPILGGIEAGFVDFVNDQ